MSERTVAFAPGEFYHLYNRGNSKQIIFKDDFDYQRFQILLYLSNSSEYFKVDNLRREKIDFYQADRKTELVAIGAYCMMPNHFHILVTPLADNGVSLFMKKLGTAYSMFFNNRYERVGSLFEGRYKSRWADSDEYLKYLFSYIHLNPMKLFDSSWKKNASSEASIEYIKNYPFSSYWDYVNGNGRREERILNTHPFPKYFSTSEKTTHIYDWLELGPT